MKKDQEFLQKIVDGAQDKKAKRIAIVDMTKLQDAPTGYFVICEGDSTPQVNAIAHSVIDYVRENDATRPLASDGFENGQWVAIDYGYVIVHVFQRPFREFYDLEHLWHDAKLSLIPNLD